MNFFGQRAHSKFLRATWTILWWRFKFDLFEKSRPHKRHGNFFGCRICLVGLMSCSSTVFVDDGDIEVDLRICWCCWASKAAWWGFETIAINAPVVGSRNGGGGGGGVVVDVCGKVNGLYAEANDRFDKSWPLIPDENKLDRGFFDECESKIRLGENFRGEWDIGEP